MEHIKDIIASLLNNVDKNNKKRDIVSIWNRVAGEDIGKHTKPYKLQKNILFVKVNEATWVYELGQKHKRELLRKLNNELDQGTVKDIYFRVG